MDDSQQFEVIRPKCAGLNVHKKSIVAAVCTSAPVTLAASYKTKVFLTTNSDIAALRDWLLTQGCRNVCMKSTGKYWIPIFNILEPLSLRLTSAPLENSPATSSSFPTCTLRKRTVTRTV